MLFILEPLGKENLPAEGLAGLVTLEETHDHLFLQCHKIRAVWDIIGLRLVTRIWSSSHSLYFEGSWLNSVTGPKSVAGWPSQK